MRNLLSDGLPFGTDPSTGGARSHLFAPARKILGIDACHSGMYDVYKIKKCARCSLFRASLSEPHINGTNVREIYYYDDDDDDHDDHDHDGICYVRHSILSCL